MPTKMFPSERLQADVALFPRFHWQEVGLIDKFFETGIDEEIYIIVAQDKYQFRVRNRKFWQYFETTFLKLSTSKSKLKFVFSVAMNVVRMHSPQVIPESIDSGV